MRSIILYFIFIPSLLFAQQDVLDNIEEGVYSIDTIDYQGDRVVTLSDGSWQFLGVLERNNIVVKSIKQTLKETAIFDIDSAGKDKIVEIEKSTLLHKEKIKINTRTVFQYMWLTNVPFTNKIQLANLQDEIEIQLVNKEHPKMSMPVDYIILTSRFHYRYHPVDGAWRWHKGCDLGIATGSPTRSVWDGKVRFAGWCGGYGNLVIVRHYNGLETYYGHLSSIHVKPNQEVQAGDLLGAVGSTGKSTGPHLHFEIRLFDNNIDPQRILDFTNKKLIKETVTLTRHYFNYHSCASSAIHSTQLPSLKEVVTPEKEAVSVPNSIPIPLPITPVVLPITPIQPSQRTRTQEENYGDLK